MRIIQTVQAIGIASILLCALAYPIRVGMASAKCNAGITFSETSAKPQKITPFTASRPYHTRGPDYRELEAIFPVVRVHESPLVLLHSVTRSIGRTGCPDVPDTCADAPTHTAWKKAMIMIKTISCSWPRYDLTCSM